MSSKLSRALLLLCASGTQNFRLNGERERERKQFFSAHQSFESISSAHYIFLFAGVWIAIGSTFDSVTRCNLHKKEWTCQLQKYRKVRNKSRPELLAAPDNRPHQIAKSIQYKLPSIISRNLIRKVAWYRVVYTTKLLENIVSLCGSLQKIICNH